MSAHNAKKNIFISYRVQDTAGETGRLVDCLKEYFDEEQLFMDIERLEPGADFTEVIERSLESCDVMLAVIGPNWEGRGQDGDLRIDNDGDWVRLELATALKRGIWVVPVLVDGGKLPATADLPEDLHPLLRRQAYEISNTRWKYDTDNLIQFLIKTMGIMPKESILAGIAAAKKVIAKRGYWVAGIIIAIIVLIYAWPHKKAPVKQNNVEVPVVSVNEDMRGYWSNAAEVYAFDIDQRNDRLYASLYRLEEGKPLLVTNRGKGWVKGNALHLHFVVATDGNDSTLFDLDGFLSSDARHLRTTLTLLHDAQKSVKEMDLLKP